MSKYLSYLDESGCTGFSFTNNPLTGSSTYLTLACIIVHESDNPRVLKSMTRFKKFVRQNRRNLAQKHSNVELYEDIKEEIKGSTLRPLERQKFVEIVNEEIAKAGSYFRIFTKTACKTNITSQIFRTHPNALYNKLSEYVIVEPACMISDLTKFILYADDREQQIKLKNSFNDFLAVRFFDKKQDTMNLNINHKNSQDSEGVQLADIVANCVWRSYERGKVDSHGLNFYDGTFACT
jgi:hypothetical protein